MTPTKFALTIGLLLIAAGIVLGTIWQVGVVTARGPQNCGGAWFGDGDKVIGADFSGRRNPVDVHGACTDARQSRGTIALVVLVVGAVCVGGSFVRTPVKTGTSPGRIQ